MSKEALLSQINIKAKEEAENIKRSALDACAEKRKSAESRLMAEHEKKLASISEEAELAISGQKTLFRIEAKKSELGAKRELIDEVYLLVAKKIRELSDKDYKGFIAGLIAKYAEDGDKVVICQKDARILTKDWLSDVAYDLQLSLSFSSQYHEDNGGIILCGAKYDKNLTLSAIISEARNNTENAVAARLFG